MFPQRIEVTEFTRDYADNVFRVKGDNLFDAVLKTTLRVILEPKFKDGESLTIASFASGQDENDIKRNMDRGGIEAVFDDIVPSAQPKKEFTLTFVDMRSLSKIPDIITKGFVEFFPGWERMERVSKFFERDFDVICYFNREIKSVFFFIGRNDVLRMHYMTCSMPCWFPWWLTKETMTKQDIAVLSALREPRSDKWLEAIKPYEEQYDFYAMRLKTLDNFERVWVEYELESANSRIESFNSTLNDLYSRISRTLREREDACIRLNGLKATYGDEPSHEVLDYLTENAKRIRYIESDSGSLRIDIRVPLAYWDVDYAEDICNNDRSLVYSEQRGSSITKEQMKKLFNSVFVTGEIKLMSCAQYVLNIRNMEVVAVQHASYSDYCRNAFPNTHIDQYHCLGDYSQALAQAMQAHNYIGAIEQCVVSCASLNLQDTPVLERFMQTLYRTDKKCLVLPDGSEVTPKDAIKYLEGSNGEEKGEETNG